MATDVELERALRFGELDVVGRLVDSSNNALVVKVQAGGSERTAVYKPQEGERPLWDFPDETLGRREVAAFLLSQHLGWCQVPTTVWRDEGPAGPGMCQLWVEGEPPTEYISLFAPDSVPDGWLPILEGRDGANQAVVLAHADCKLLERLVVFDFLANNADRKAGHLIASNEAGVEHLWAIDHGIAFHVEPKLRTVLWGFVGRGLPAEIIDDLESFLSATDRFSVDVSAHISADEVYAVRHRAEVLLTSKQFPIPAGNGPAVPWPIF